MDQKPPKLPLMKLPAPKRDLVALFKCYGPWWMLAALVVVTIPWAFLTAGYFVTAVSGLVKAMH